MSIIIKEERHVFTSDEKLKYLGNGEWVEEVDLLKFEYLGYQASIKRVLIEEPYARKKTFFGGHLCGYIQIPRDHTLFGKEDIDLDCHCGVTSNGIHEEHWVGFDCGHLLDIVPSVEKRLKEFGSQDAHLEKILSPLLKKSYKNLEFCIAQCKGMIEQLIEIRVAK